MYLTVINDIKMKKRVRFITFIAVTLVFTSVISASTNHVKPLKCRHMLNGEEYEIDKEYALFLLNEKLPSIMEKMSGLGIDPVKIFK